MSNATKTLAAVFAVLLVLTGMVEWLSRPSASAAFKGTLLAVDTAAVRRVVIHRPDSGGADVVLARAEEGWTVQRADARKGYPARAAAVEQALGQLAAVDVEGVVTRRKSEYTRYGVDSTGTRVRLLGAGGRLLATLTVGRSQAVAGARTYVRPGDAPTVYAVEGALASTFDHGVGAWRDKAMWSLDRSTIVRVELGLPADSAYTLKRVLGDSAQAWVSAGDTLDRSRVSRLVGELAMLSAEGFAPEASPEAFGEPRYTVRIYLEDDTQKTLRFKKSGEGGSYRVIASGYPYVFTVSRSVWDDAVFVGREELLDAEAAE